MTDSIPPHLLRRARHLAVEPLESGAYRVTGGSAPHVVRAVSGATAVCDCPYFPPGHICKHLVRVWDWLQSPEPLR